MNKKVLSAVIQLKQNNNKILRGVVQNDTGVILDIRVMDGLVPFDFSGYGIVTIKVIKPDETIYINSNGSDLVDTINARSGRFKIGIPASLTAQPGMHFVTIGFGESSNTYFQTVAFNYFVGEDATISDSTIEGSDEFPILTNLIAQFSHMAEELQRFEDEEHDRQTNEAQRELEFLALKQQIEDLKQEAQQTKAMFNYVLQAIQDAGVTLPIPVDTSDLVLQDDLDDYATMTYVDHSIQDLDLPQVVIQTTAPLNIDKIWIDVSGVSPVIKFYRNNAWQTANVAVFA
jgi:hypothetical protein